MAMKVSMGPSPEWKGSDTQSMARYAGGFIVLCLAVAIGSQVVRGGEDGGRDGGTDSEGGTIGALVDLREQFGGCLDDTEYDTDPKDGRWRGNIDIEDSIISVTPTGDGAPLIFEIASDDGSLEPADKFTKKQLGALAC